MPTGKLWTEMSGKLSTEISGKLWCGISTKLDDETKQDLLLKSITTDTITEVAKICERNRYKLIVRFLYVEMSNPDSKWFTLEK